MLTAPGQTDTRIAQLRARRVWDSRGRPTLEAEVTLADGSTGRAMAPAGASRGSREALELRDGGTRLGGLDVTLAVAGVNGEIAALLRGMDAADQAGIDAAMIAPEDPLTPEMRAEMESLRARAPRSKAKTDASTRSISGKSVSASAVST